MLTEIDHVRFSSTEARRCWMNMWKEEWRDIHMELDS